MAFLLDSSGSIGVNSYNDMKRFINEVIDHFTVSPKGKQGKTLLTVHIQLVKCSLPVVFTSLK